MLAGSRIRAVLLGSFRLLTFRSRREELLDLDRAHLVLGLLTTWCIGMGRYWLAPGRSWLDPYALWWRAAGLSSLAYLGALSLGWWLLFLPLRPEGWSFRRVLTFMSVLSLPGAVQTIPLSDFMPWWEAMESGAWLLGAIVIWRSGLVLWFLVRVGRVPWPAALLAMLLPLNLIPIALSHFDARHPIDEYLNYWRSLDIILLYGVLLLPVSLCGYLASVVWSHRARRAKRAAAPSAKSD